MATGVYMGRINIKYIVLNTIDIMKLRIVFFESF